MSRKSKGIAKERELIHLFWKTKEWAAVRVAGSGNTQYPSADIIAGNALRKLVIECKSSKADAMYIPKEEIAALKEFATTFHAEAWIAARFNGLAWHFISLEDIEMTQKSAAITKKNIKTKGLLFEELIRKY